jgi:DNA repair protein RadC
LPEFHELSKIVGLGQAKACQILACLELSSRFLLGGTGATITTPSQLVPQLSFLKHQTQEHMVCICLNGANRVSGVHILTIGLANQTQIHPREAFSRALLDHAVSVIFAHNHPSGTLKPSTEDLRITEKLVESGKILEIPVLDHLIISREGWSSLKSTHPLCFH